MRRRSRTFRSQLYEREFVYSSIHAGMRAAAPVLQKLLGACWGHTAGRTVLRRLRLRARRLGLHLEMGHRNARNGES